MAEVQSAPSPRPAWQRRLASLPAAIGHQLFPWFAHRSEQGTRSSDSFRRAGMAGGGVIVAKKVLWGVAGLAVVVILSVVYLNGRTVDQGAQGAIGAADRYRGAQPSSVDAKMGNAQAFLQSDTFDKIVKNKEIRSLLSDAALCKLLADDDVQAALKADGSVRFLADPDAQASLKKWRLQGEGDAAAALIAEEQAALFAQAPGRGAGGHVPQDGGRGAGGADAPAGGRGAGRADAPAGGRGAGRADAPAGGRGAGRADAPDGRRGAGRADAPAGRRGAGRADAPAGRRGAGRADAPARGRGAGRAEEPAAGG